MLAACMSWIGWWWWIALIANAVVFLFFLPKTLATHIAYWIILLALNAYSGVRLVRGRRYWRAREREYQERRRERTQARLWRWSQAGYGEKFAALLDPAERRATITPRGNSSEKRDG